MSYCCNYNIYSKGKLVKEIRATSCFAGYYTSIYNYSSIDIYIIKDYAKFKTDIYSNQNNCKFTEKEVEKYIKYLQEIGFHLELVKDAKCVFPQEKDKEHESYLVKIPIGKETNSSLSTLILMNAIRYLYESPYQTIAESFLFLGKSKNPEILMFNRFLMAHRNVSGNAGTGHMCSGMYTMEKLLTQAQIDSIFLKNYAEKSAVQGQLPTLKGNQGAERAEIKKMLENKLNINEIYLKYKEICEKYS